MKNIIAKFQCGSIVPAAEGYPTTAHLNAVYANSDGTINEENKSFSEATPCGTIEISISPNVPAHKFFRSNRYYYVRFERIPMTEQEIANDLYWKKQQEEKSKEK